jgi:hypothetical protein
MAFDAIRTHPRPYAENVTKTVFDLWFPPPILWLVARLIALVWRRPSHALALVTPTVAVTLLIVAIALGAPAIPHFAVPVLPAFALPLGGALLGPRAPASRSR